MKALTVILTLLLIALSYQLLVSDKGLSRVQFLETKLKRQQDKNKSLLQRNLVLEAEVKDLRRGKRALEERARSELGMIKRDEKFYQFVKPHHK